MPLAAFLREAARADRVVVEEEERLVGGAIQENRALTAVFEGGPFAGRQRFVLRSEPAAAVPESRPLGQQFALLETAAAAGVTVPEPLWHCADPAVNGKPFYVMRRVFGESMATRITRGGPRPGLAVRLGEELARIHAIAPPNDALGFLGPAPSSPALEAVAKYRRYLDEASEPHPALEWTLRRLEARAPAAREIVLCHRDFRTGNYMADGDRVTGVLDWEFAGWGDPHEDLAWFCARCWRFSAPEREAGGIADRDEFYRAYESASGRATDAETIRWWETIAHVRWAIIALHQAMRHRSGAEPNLELALIGRKLAELEYECLRLTGAA